MPLREAASAAGGLVLAATFAAVARLRRGRPLHPQGATYAATITISGAGESGVPWLDDSGTHDATLRVSRGVGLPLALPDVYGVAIRIQGLADDPADLLFASTGDSPLGRFLFAPRAAVEHGPMTTLLPVRSERGPLVLRLTPADRAPAAELALPSPLLLSYALGTGDWWPAGEVRVGDRLGLETELERHDTVAHPLPGIAHYNVVRLLRGPAYRAARSEPIRAGEH
ncbi:MAG TPA: hypothetical protein VES03_02000 [Motilibacterales bacterium]|nr:hypothetical protein [Motilibacterales bacterium]